MTEERTVDRTAPGDVPGAIFNIQRFCTHDGPGIRTTVFLKGCPLRCPWCHNPEGMSRETEIGYDPRKCIGCRACLEACERGGHAFRADGAHLYAPENCIRCGACAETCYAGAMERIGETKTAREVVDVVLRDKPFYDNSGGGATLSGGEPLYQPEFTGAILTLCRESGIHTAMETSVATGWDRVERLLPLVDLWMCDVKHAIPDRHRELTGSDNRAVKDNIRRLSERKASILLRLPLVPGLNDDEEGLRALAGFAAAVRPSEGLEVIPYHRLGQGKYPRLLKDDPMNGRSEASDEDILRSLRILREDAGGPVFCERIEGG